MATYTFSVDDKRTVSVRRSDQASTKTVGFFITADGECTGMASDWMFPDMSITRYECFEYYNAVTASYHRMALTGMDFSQEQPEPPPLETRNAWWPGLTEEEIREEILAERNKRIQARISLLALQAETERERERRQAEEAALRARVRAEFEGESEEEELRQTLITSGREDLLSRL